MATIDEGFTWPRAHDYEFEEPRAASAPIRRRAPQLFLEPEERKALLIASLISPVKKQDTLASPSEPDRGAIVQRGKGCDLVRPLSADPDLCLKFASLEETPAACLEFAKRWGLLARKAKAAASESLNSWYFEIRRMRAFIEAEQLSLPDEGFPLDLAHIVLRRGADGVARVQSQPATLRAALWLQLGQRLVAGRASLMNCDNCGRWFTVGSSGRRRGIARFCSTTCKNAYHNARRVAGG